MYPEVILGFYVCVCVVFQDSGEQTQSMEHLEFQKLEREINQGEEKDDQSREILREIAECQRVAVARKVRDREDVC